jgi:hypothetical protein
MKCCTQAKFGLAAAHLKRQAFSPNLVDPEKVDLGDLKLRMKGFVAF